jgi:hypothetical protein
MLCKGLLDKKSFQDLHSLSLDIVGTNVNKFFSLTFWWTKTGQKNDILVKFDQFFKKKKKFGLLFSKMLESGVLSGFIAGLSVGLGVAFLIRPKLGRPDSDKPVKNRIPDNDEDEWEDEDTESEEG